MLLSRHLITPAKFAAPDVTLQRAAPEVAHTHISTLNDWLNYQTLGQALQGASQGGVPVASNGCPGRSHRSLQGLTQGCCFSSQADGTDPNCVGQ
jgi:hypothetical protein